MRVVFMGTPAFALPSLRAVASRHEVAAVYTRPDKPSGRGRTPTPSPVKTTAEELGLAVVQPPTLRDPAETERLSALRPDAVCVAAYGLLLPDEILAVPPLGCVNVHASLLPEYRGAAPVQRAILEGAERTGVTIMRVVRELDAGPYAARVEVPVGDADAAALSGALAEAGAAALVAVLGEMERGTVVWVAQDETRATYAPKVTAEDVALHPSLPVDAALRRVRASTASAPCRALVGQKRVVVVAAAPSPERLAPGGVSATRDGLHLGLADGALRLDRVRPEGRGEMDGAAFARGARFPPGATWDSWA
ncbi:MAG: methionyl-tRNA formyltransferase [Coriobacteriia bacterium]|nr:methionyl-tRNA formyltransferase [Coriobacteriia bacterium]